MGKYGETTRDESNYLENNSFIKVHKSVKLRVLFVQYFRQSVCFYELVGSCLVVVLVGLISHFSHSLI